MAQMQTLSIRIPEEDFQWLLSQDDTDAKTPSEKLRNLLSKVRQQEDGITQPELCSAWMRNLAQPLFDATLSLERKHKTHSDIISAALESVPQIMATLASSRFSEKNMVEDGIETEALLAQQCCRLMTSILRAAVTSNPSTYDKKVLDRFIPEVAEIVTIIANKERKEKQNG